MYNVNIISKFSHSVDEEIIVAVTIVCDFPAYRRDLLHVIKLTSFPCQPRSHALLSPVSPSGSGSARGSSTKAGGLYLLHVDT